MKGLTGAKTSGPYARYARDENAVKMTNRMAKAAEEERRGVSE